MARLRKDMPVICSNCGTEYQVENWRKGYEAYCQECIRTGQQPVGATQRWVVRLGAVIIVVFVASLLLRLW